MIERSVFLKRQRMAMRGLRLLDSSLAPPFLSRKGIPMRLRCLCRLKGIEIGLLSTRSAKNDFLSVTHGLLKLGRGLGKVPGQVLRRVVGEVG